MLYISETDSKSVSIRDQKGSSNRLSQPTKSHRDVILLQHYGVSDIYQLSTIQTIIITKGQTRMYFKASPRRTQGGGGDQATYSPRFAIKKH